MTLFAIYKNGTHKGNERALTGEEAIKKYIIASDFAYFLDDPEFVKQYSFQVAVHGIHFAGNWRSSASK